VEAFTADPALLGEAMRDRLHQDARLALVPSVREVFDAMRGAGVPVCVSGAGPTLLSFPGSHDVLEPRSGWRVVPLAVRATGFDIERG
jgi:homoserine kinase